MKLKVAPSSHLVLNLFDLSRLMWNVRFGKHKKSSFLTYYSHFKYGLHLKTVGSSSQEEEAENLVLAVDDEWVINEADMEMIRIHKRVRKAKYEPKEGSVPIPLEYLDKEFSSGKKATQEDDWRSSERSTTKSTESWKGKTSIECRTSVPASTLDPARGKVGSPEDTISKGKPEDSSEKTGAAGGLPPKRNR